MLNRLFELDQTEIFSPLDETVLKLDIFTILFYFLL